MNLTHRTHLVWIVGLVLKLATAGNCGAAPPVVEQAFASKYPGVGMPQWGIDAHGQWEAKFEKDGTTLRADFTDQGTWIQTEQSIESQQLPGPVRAVIETRFGGEMLVEVEAVDSPKFGHYFDVEFKRDGGKNRDIAFDERGNEVDLSGVGAGPLMLLDEVNQSLSTPEKKFSNLELLFEFLFNFVTIFVFAYVIYYLRHHDHRMLYLLLAFNLFLFPIFLFHSAMTAGFGFTLFALLSLVRLRSDTFNKAEVAYLLGALALTFVNALLPTGIQMVGVAFILITAYVADHPSIWSAAYQTVQLRYRISETERMLDVDFLRDRIAHEFQIEVSAIEIERVEWKVVYLIVMYRDLPGNREEKRKKVFAQGKGKWGAKKKAAKPEEEPG